MKNIPTGLLRYEVKLACHITCVHVCGPGAHVSMNHRCCQLVKQEEQLSVMASKHISALSSNSLSGFVIMKRVLTFFKVKSENWFSSSLRCHCQDKHTLTWIFAYLPRYWTVSSHIDILLILCLILCCMDWKWKLAIFLLLFCCCCMFSSRWKLLIM